MKIGPIEVSRSSKAAPKIELGAPGTVIISGNLIDEEYNSDLRGDKAIRVFDKMRRSDGQVKAALLACSLPIRAAMWDVKPASDSALDIEVADFVRTNLFDRMTITWDDFLRHALLMLPFGFSMFEKVWELVDGKYQYRKFAPRLPKTLHKWYVDPATGGLRGIEQLVWKNDSYSYVDIPISKLLIFTMDREGANYAGTSVLRSAYKHWYYKDSLYRIDGIAAERHGVGVALFKLPPTATTEGNDSDYGRINKIGQTLHTHERSYVALPNTYEFELRGVTGQIHDTMKSIDHHDIQIVRSVLAQFINLGAKTTGSYALSADQSGFFLMALEATGKNICEMINRYAIPQLVDWNWNVDSYPKLTMSGLEARDMGKYSKAIVDMVKEGILPKDKALEAEMRRFLHLPAGAAVTEDDPVEPEVKPEVVVEVEPAEPVETPAASKLRLAEAQLPRRPRGAEVFVAFDRIGMELDSAVSVLVREAKSVQDRQIAKVVEMVAKDIETNQLDKIVAIDIPRDLRDQMATAIEGVLVGLFEFGQEQVKAELVAQGATVKALEPMASAGKGDMRKFIRTRSKAVAGVLGSKLRAAMAWEAMRQANAGLVDRASLVAALTDMSDRELVATAQFSVSESFNFGRQLEATRQAKIINRVQYSALLDDNTCDNCAMLDGTEYEFPSADWDAVAPPLKTCDGRDRCRCVGIFIMEESK